MEDTAVVEKEPPVSAESEVGKEREVKKPQRRSKEEKLSRKKDEKSVEQVLKALNSLSTPEEKLAAMCKKYTELFDESKKHQMSAKAAEKKLISLQREKEQLQGEQSKAVLTRSRLENLCRELQRQNKAMKEESLLRIREEEEKRKEVSAKFHATLADITTLMQQNTESNAKLRDENLEMQTKFKSVCEQYELREQQVDKISKQMKLESQLAEAKLRKAKLEMLAEKEILERDMHTTMAELAMCKSKIVDHEKTEESLRAQINVYFEKYDEFQNVLTKSNQVYSGFKGEMEKMSKKITRLEKETSSWKQKWEGSHKALLQLAAEKQMKDAEVQLQARQLTQLQYLCRSLQTERTALLQQLKSLGITPKVDDTTPEQENKETKPEPSKPAKESKAKSLPKPVENVPLLEEHIAESTPDSKKDVSLPTEQASDDAQTVSPLPTDIKPIDDQTVTGTTLPDADKTSVTTQNPENVPAAIAEDKSSSNNVITAIGIPTLPNNSDNIHENVTKLGADVIHTTATTVTEPNEAPVVAVDTAVNAPSPSSIEVDPSSSPDTSSVVKLNVTSPVSNGISTPDVHGKKGAGSPSGSDKKASPPGKSSTAAPGAGEQKKGKEGGRRRKK